MHDVVAGLLYLAVAAGLFLARRRLGTFASVGAFYVLSIVYLAAGFVPALPASALKLYLVIVTVAVLLYVTSSEQATRDFFAPIKALIVRPAWRPVLWAAMAIIPLVVAGWTYASIQPTATPPPRIRSVHPAPPTTITFQPPGATEAKTFHVLEDASPIRQLETSNPELFKQKVAHGKEVYYQNCVFCHGDTLEADGPYAHAVKPPPANFQDTGTIAMLTETFLFWRIAKGGPGLPEEGTPYDSSMPVWEKFLAEDDVWSAILFLYDYTGTRPRAQEALHETGKMPDVTPGTPGPATATPGGATTATPALSGGTPVTAPPSATGASGTAAAPPAAPAAPPATAAPSGPTGGAKP